MSQEDDINSNNKHSNSLELGPQKKNISSSYHILIAAWYLLIKYWAQCNHWSTCQLWALLWPDSAWILQHLCADWQWNTEESGDGGGANSWGISCNVSTIQTYCYDDHHLITLAAKDKSKDLWRVDYNYTWHWRTSCELIRRRDYVYCRPGKSFWVLFTKFSFLLSFARECLVPGEMTNEVLRVLFLTGSLLKDRLWILHWLKTRKMITASTMRPLVLCFALSIWTGLTLGKLFCLFTVVTVFV